MKGYPNHASTGKRANAWVLVLREEVERSQLQMDPAGMTPHGQELVRALGVRLVSPIERAEASAQS